MRRKIPLWLALFGMLLVATLGLKLAMHYYSKSLEVRLNPVHSDRFTLEKSQLANRGLSSKRIILFGDSRIEMWSLVPELADYEVINRGIGGDTSAQALLRLQRDVIDLNPDVVVIQLGINDLKAIGVMPEKKEWITKQLKQNIREITEQLNQYGTRVLLMTVFPTAEPDMIRRLVWSDEIGQSVMTINQYIRSLLSDKVQILDCDPAFDLNGKMRPEYALDTLHLNAKGYEALDKLMQSSFMTMAASKEEVEQ